MYRQDLTIRSPFMNAAGTLGFAPPARWPISEPVGAFLTNPISLGPRTPAGDRGLLIFPGGLLLHSGLPNPGLSRVLRKCGERWEQSVLPIWVHLIGASPDEIHQMVRRLEGQEGVMAVEVGIPPGANGDKALAFVDSALGELPVIAHLPFTTAGEAWLNELPKLGAAAISLGAPRGLLPSVEGRLAGGRLYGPALFPQILAAVQSTRQLGMPVIAGAGVYRRKDAQALLDTGAWAIQLDTVLWRGWFD